MFSLSRESERSLIDSLLKIVEGFLKSYQQTQRKTLPLLTQKEVMEELGVSYATLARWEGLGLKRYTPPVEDTRTVYYHKTDILLFLGVERGQI